MKLTNCQVWKKEQILRQSRRAKNAKEIAELKKMGTQDIEKETKSEVEVRDLKSRFTRRHADIRQLKNHLKRLEGKMRKDASMNHDQYTPELQELPQQIQAKDENFHKLEDELRQKNGDVQTLDACVLGL